MMPRVIQFGVCLVQGQRPVNKKHVLESSSRVTKKGAANGGPYGFARDPAGLHPERISYRTMLRKQPLLPST
jgi:hypothetical protein